MSLDRITPRRTLLQIRESDARQLAAYLRGETDQHPHGQSGRDRIIPHVEDSNMRFNGEPYQQGRYE